MNGRARALSNEKPLLGITMGEPSGIGAEVAVRALADPEVRGLARFIVYGMFEQICYAADLAEINPFWFRRPHDDIGPIESGVVIADFDEYAMFGPAIRQATAEGGHASLRFIDEAIGDLKRERLDGVVTGPIDKTSWRMAGSSFPGHTEKFAKAFRVRRYAMMFDGGGMRVALASTHVPLFELRHSFTIGRVFTPIDLLDRALREWYEVEEPKIAVCGLNPHAGEHGMFGDEETRIIEPAMTMAREAGMNVEGPFPADTVFQQARKGDFDGIVAMYHDQGLIPLKLLAFGSAVNVTLGLPIIRTSVDHGVAYDIVGRNKADPGSMKSAIRLAVRLAVVRRRRLLEAAQEKAGLPAEPTGE
jgi:4-hydroxythreonine-4-phosphate dehydrogenase